MTIKVGRVAMVPLSSIIVEDRVREEMGDLVGLEGSMKQSGLAQPLAVKELPNKQYRLLAGGRRYTVLLTNQVPEVPVRIYDEDLTELEMKVIEKAENFYRKDMEYWEMDRLVAEIHELEQQIKGAANRGPGSTGHTLKDTAEMVGKTDAFVSGAIKRHNARESFPELFANCKTQKDASNVMKKVSAAAVNQCIAEKLENEKQEGTLLTKLSRAYITGDFFKGVKKIPDEVMNFVEIDPPYSIGLNKGNKKKSDGESQYLKDEYNEVDPEVFILGDKDGTWKGIRKVFQECYRVMVPHSWLICWYGPEPWAEIIYDEITRAGFKTHRMVGEWIKPTGQTLQPNTRLGNAYETFYYAMKGQPVLGRPGHTNTFPYPPVPPIQKTHPTERPLELMRDIYSTFGHPGNRVLIPFLGSGSGLIAANQLGMDGIGWELSKSYRDSFLVKINDI